MTPARRRAIFRRLEEANPHPTTELLNDSPFELLVAVMLSAHTTDKSVNAATRKLFPVANTPAAIVKLGVEGVKPYIKTVGLYNTKAVNLIGLAQQIVDKHAGEVPNTREDLEALPGVGRKTASIILNMVFGQNEIAVDTHIFRVANRTGLAPGKTPREVEDGLVATTPKEYIKDAHHWLLLHGRYVCVARLPACPKCIIADLCEYPDKTPAKKLEKSDAPVVRKVGPRPHTETRVPGEGEPTSRSRAGAGKAAAKSSASGSGAKGRGVGKSASTRATVARTGKSVDGSQGVANSGARGAKLSRGANAKNRGEGAAKAAVSKASPASGTGRVRKRKPRPVGKLI
jgi:endonuclease-3